MLRTQDTDSMSAPRSRATSISASQVARNEDALSSDFGRALRKSARIQTKPQHFMGLDDDEEEHIQLHPVPTAPVLSGGVTP